MVVFYDGTDYWLGDGFHRVEATKLASNGFDNVDIRSAMSGIDAEIRSGTREDAIEYACGANATHGLPRANIDKRNAVKRLLSLSKWQKDRSNREIAKQCGVTEFLVRTIRGELPEDHPAAIKSQKPTSQPVEPSDVAEEPRLAEIWEDKRNTVKEFLANPESEGLSNVAIAVRCGVDWAQVMIETTYIGDRGGNLTLCQICQGLPLRSLLLQRIFCTGYYCNMFAESANNL